MSERLREWDESLNRYFVYVSQARDLKPVDKKESFADSFVKIKSEVGKSEKVNKTHTIKKETNPIWNEFFYFDKAPEKSLFQVRVDAFGQQNLGEALLRDTAKQEGDVLQETWLNLAPVEKNHTTQAKLLVRTVSAQQPSTRASLVGNHTDVFYYKDYLSSFAHGDLIFYGGVGPYDCLEKLESGSNYSQVGMVLSLASRHTCEAELYVIEASDNLDLIMDEFREDKLPGVNIYPLHERIHSFHGNAIWWLPLSSTLDIDKFQSLSTLAKTLNAGRVFYTEGNKKKKDSKSTFVEPHMTTFKQEMMAHFFDPKKDESRYFPAYGPQLIGLLQQAAGLASQGVDLSKWSPNDCANLNAYKNSKMTLLRATKGSSLCLKEGHFFEATHSSYNPDLSNSKASDQIMKLQDTQIEMFRMMISYSEALVDEGLEATQEHEHMLENQPLSELAYGVEKPNPMEKARTTGDVGPPKKKKKKKTVMVP